MKLFSKLDTHTHDWLSEFFLRHSDIKSNKPKSFWNGLVWNLKLFFGSEAKLFACGNKILDISLDNFVWNQPNCVILSLSLTLFGFIEIFNRKLKSVPLDVSHHHHHPILLCCKFFFNFSNLCSANLYTRTCMHRQIKSQKMTQASGKIGKDEQGKNLEQTCLCLSLFNNNKLKILFNNWMFGVKVGWATMQWKKSMGKQCSYATSPIKIDLNRIERKLLLK